MSLRQSHLLVEQLKQKLSTLLENRLPPPFYSRVRGVWRACRSRPPGHQKINHVVNTVLGRSRIIPWSTGVGAASSTSPVVSIVIPTRDRAALLRRAVKTLFENSDWPNKELIIVDNGSVEQSTVALFERMRGLPNVVILRHDETFNFARLINAGARASRGEVLAFLNNDVETEDRNWLAPLGRIAVDPRVGVVGPKLLHPDGSVQHAGIVLGIGGFVGHAGRWRAADDPGPYGMLTTTRRISAVTGACLLTRRDVFDAIGGFDEAFPVEFNDVDYCLRVAMAGYAVVYAAAPSLVHKEGSTRQTAPLREQERMDQRLFVQRWGRALIDDPYYPVELTVSDESLTLAQEEHRA
jgi:GT2 family glycosyltransferase